MNVRQGSILGVVGAVTAALAIPLLIGAGGAAAACDPAAAAALPTPSTGPIKLKGKVGNWNQVQVGNAAVILDQGRRQKVPARGWVIALATAMQESHIRNLANSNVPRSLLLPHDGVGHNLDSVGVFQQRPLPPDGAGGWGTVAELMSVRTAAAKFYAHLLKEVPNWQKLPLTEAAQAVQGSGTPTAYAKWEDDAKRLTAALLGLPNLASIGGEGPEAPCGTAALGDVPVSRHGWVAPMKEPLTSKFGMRWGRLHAGVDLSGPRGTPIRAAAAGKVIYAGCSPSTGNCDVDGSISTPGYGWHVEILHQGHVVTRYGHMARRPEVHVGQVVKAGQVIGFEGMSGNVTGPHLHFEIHTHVADGGPVDNANAIDPEPFMRQRGVVLG